VGTQRLSAFTEVVKKRCWGMGRKEVEGEVNQRSHINGGAAPAAGAGEQVKTHSVHTAKSRTTAQNESEEEYDKAKGGKSRKKKKGSKEKGGRNSSRTANSKKIRKIGHKGRSQEKLTVKKDSTGKGGGRKSGKGPARGSGREIQGKTVGNTPSRQ